MSNPVTGGWDYVAGGYGATAVLLGGYVLSVLRRGRVLRRRLPAGSPASPVLAEVRPAATAEEGR